MRIHWYNHHQLKYTNSYLIDPALGGRELAAFFLGVLAAFLVPRLLRVLPVFVHSLLGVAAAIRRRISVTTLWVMVVSAAPIPLSILAAVVLTTIMILGIVISVIPRASRLLTPIIELIEFVSPMRRSH